VCLSFCRHQILTLCRLQVNHLSTMLLSLLLLPRMLQTADVYGTHPHMAVVCSETHFTTDFDKLKKLLAAPSFLEEMSSREYCTRMSVASRHTAHKC
jgi:retinol dehydrogenase-12